MIKSVYQPTIKYFSTVFITKNTNVMNSLKNLIFTGVILILFGCSDNIIDPTDPADQNDPPLSEQGNDVDLYNSMIDLGFKSFVQINSADESENILISPLSIETALYMVANGAEDETLTEIREALEYGDFFPSGINKLFEDLLDKINNDASDKTSLNLAQAAFYNPNLFTINNDFKSNLEEYYSADVFDDKFDLASINGWANEKTESRIPKVLDKIKETEFMFLMNALYFLGDWDKPFDVKDTRDANFQFIDGLRPTVPMMNQDETIAHYIGDDLKAVDLQFADNKFAMTFIQTPKTVDEYLNANTYQEIAERYKALVADQLQASRLLLNLPKFEIKYKRELSPDLKAMGMQRAFDEANAQLNKVGTAGGNIYLTRVIHDTYLKIDEKGAEGAAVTTVGFGAESVPPSISFDRPFLLVLRHIETGIPIFIGKISDPLT